MQRSMGEPRRRLPVGAEVRGGGGVDFRVWAPTRRRVSVVLEGGPSGVEVPLQAEPGGYFSGIVEQARALTLYRFRLDGDPELYPDPASRFQPEGPHGPSQVVDPDAYEWSDAEWRGPAAEGQVIYEMHIGTFTPKGTWTAAARVLPELADTGISMLEVMPVADFPGRFGWGYDGVDLFAPTRLYGVPDDFRRFVDEAHRLGLAVILDVVYNHLGPDGNYLRAYSPAYFTDRYENEWGDALNFDGEDAGPVREFFAANAGYWVDEYHLDGLRLDATQQIFDASPTHILAEIGRRVRESARGRRSYVVNENETQEARLVRPVEEGGYGLDAIWNDDFHHSTRVAATGRREAYFHDYAGTAQELVSAIKRGFLFQGQRYAWQDKRRGTPTRDLPAHVFVHFLQNHDQVANTPGGRRLHQVTDLARFRALTALLLLAPQTPMLFQGQEFAASTPFYYFADHVPELAVKVRAGRVEFLKQFPGLRTPGAERLIPDPDAAATFEASRLVPAERRDHAEATALHRDLLRLRRQDRAIAAAPPVDGAVLGREALALRWFAPDEDDRLLLVNLGPDLVSGSVAEPLVAPPAGQRWELLWASEDPRYGGSGAPAPEREDGWCIGAHSAVLLRPRPVPPAEGGGVTGVEPAEGRSTHG
ncbi:MAG TPA: malto-oligosyltrehalose trehalohydrolase [Longimicrobiales bacterium]|nr:malto-oligosyltrehalose trehalohydrolase [Longimicrobiales bacterium]